MGYNNTEFQLYFKVCLANHCHVSTCLRSVLSNINNIQEICPSFSGNACIIESVKLFQLKRIRFKYHLETCLTFIKTINISGILSVCLNSEANRLTTSVLLFFFPCAT